MTRSTLDQSTLRNRLRTAGSTRPRVARRYFASDIVAPRNREKYVTVRSGEKTKAKAAAPRRSPVAVPSLPRQSKSRTLRREGVRHQRPRRKKQISFRRWAFSALAVASLTAGVLISYDGWRANQAVAAQAAALTRAANAADKKSGSAAASVNSTSDVSSNPAPATDQPTAAQIAAYTVAPTMPRYLVIPKINVKARVMQLGLTKTGALATPSNVFDAGWYTGSAQPGKPGAALVDGHISSWSTHGIFYNLKDLHAGDQMQIIRGDNSAITYQVVKTQTYPDTDTDMTAALTPVVAGKNGLNLISCYGTVKPGTNEFDQRIVVFTKQVAS